MQSVALLTRIAAVNGGAWAAPHGSIITYCRLLTNADITLGYLIKQRRDRAVYATLDDGIWCCAVTLLTQDKSRLSGRSGGAEKWCKQGRWPTSRSVDIK